MSKHTPTPWRIERHGPNGLFLYIADNNGELVACLGDCEQPEEEIHANAERIVRCVNSYESLLAALGECFTDDMAFCTSELSFSDMRGRFIRRLRAINEIVRATRAKAEA